LLLFFWGDDIFLLVHLFLFFDCLFFWCVCSLCVVSFLWAITFASSSRVVVFWVIVIINSQQQQPHEDQLHPISSSQSATGADMCMEDGDWSVMLQCG
jgi:hypothetical protein